MHKAPYAISDDLLLHYVGKANVRQLDNKTKVGSS